MHVVRLMIDRRINGKEPDGHPCHSMLPIELNQGANVEIIQCSFMSQGIGYSLIKITDVDSPYEVSDFMKEAPSMFGECSVIKTGRNQYLATVVNNNCRLAQIVSESGCFLSSAIPYNDYEIEWTVFAMNSVYISNLIERMKRDGYGVRKLSSEEYDAENSLTDRQELIVNYAYEHGYYDVPKKINTDDLCAKFGISKSTMSVILRGAEKRIIGQYLDINREQHLRR